MHCPKGQYFSLSSHLIAHTKKPPHSEGGVEPKREAGLCCHGQCFNPKREGILPYATSMFQSHMSMMLL